MVAGTPSAMLPYARPPCEGRHHAGCVDFPNLVIVKIRQIDISSVVDSQIGNEIDLGAEGRSIVAHVPLVSVARDRCNDAVGIHLANAIVCAIRNI